MPHSEAACSPPVSLLLPLDSGETHRGAARWRVAASTILGELASARGGRRFHPVHRSYRCGSPDVAAAAISAAACERATRGPRSIKRRRVPA
jgi:hypothetical protein